MRVIENTKCMYWQCITSTNCVQIGSIATAAGVGGGAFFVPLFNILLNFSKCPDSLANGSCDLDSLQTCTWARCHASLNLSYHRLKLFGCTCRCEGVNGAVPGSDRGRGDCRGGSHAAQEASARPSAAPHGLRHCPHAAPLPAAGRVLWVGHAASLLGSCPALASTLLPCYHLQGLGVYHLPLLPEFSVSSYSDKAF